MSKTSDTIKTYCYECPNQKDVISWLSKQFVKNKGVDHAVFEANLIHLNVKINVFKNVILNIDVCTIILWQIKR